MDSDDVASYGVSLKVGRKATMSASASEGIVEHVRERNSLLSLIVSISERERYVFSYRCSYFQTGSD